MKLDSRSHRLVCLTGFMGAGKSTVARLLARQTGWEHIDLDKRIVLATGLSIPEIFSRSGEAAFRQIETEQLARALGEAAEGGKRRILSLGGGTTVQPQNRDLLQERQATLIWLDCPVDELLRRCAQITDRPLFRDEATFRSLFEQRRPVYQLADFRVESDVEPLQIVERILALGIFPKVVV
ncbi:MAG TPA: shikimate kinase [Verrucomicrobiae bacterium]|nr:shikimate kinase [Verrucomicrobiae bacterium]